MHVPVMLAECVDLLGPALEGDEPVMVDATVGMGGHSADFLRRFERLDVIALDRDSEALEIARANLAEFGSRVRFVHARHLDLDRALASAGAPEVNAVLFDLGVSSWQIDSAHRGFAYSFDAPLDMRMDPDEDMTAADVVNGFSEEQLRRILREYGEEPSARRIAEAIVRARRSRRITTSGQLVDIVRSAVPAPARRTGGNPSKRTFQALRIAVNDEIASLPVGLDKGIAALSAGGRIAVISYHSLEDRIVKRRFASGSQPRVPADFPVIPRDALPELRLLTRHPRVPSSEEISGNRRARSARLRAAERVREAA